MWFKLAGADFSKNNLGTMSSISSSYLINYSKLTGMSGTPTSVSYAGSSAGTAKNVEVTITVTSGYSFKSGSKITASGGTTGTVFTADKDYAGGSTFKFSMSVTGNVELTGAADAVSTGGGSTGGGGVEDDDNTSGGGGTTTSVTWKSGGFQATGALNVLTNRAHAFVKVDDASNATVTGTDSVEYCLYGFSTTSGSSILGKLASFVPGSNTSSNMITALSDVISDTSKIKYIGLTGKLSSNGDISDFNAYADNFTFTGVSDAIESFVAASESSGSSSTSTVFEAGALLSADGTEVSNNARARTINAYPIKEGTVTTTGGYTHIVFFYGDADATNYIKADNAGIWTTSTSLSDVAPSGASYYRVVVKNAEGSTIDVKAVEQNTTLVQ